MKNEIIQFDLDNEMDIVMAHKRAIQVADITGMSVSDQTRFATAVSEISRNCIEHAKKGGISFAIREEKAGLVLEAEIKDSGPGIPDISTILSQKEVDVRFKGAGIINSRKLVDRFNIDTCETGTCVRLGKYIPTNHPPINNLIIRGWHKHFTTQVSISPYEEIKNRNIQLLELADQLNAKKMEADHQVEEIKKLNYILERKNENLKQVAYTLAHDLKNPINTIGLSCEMILKSEDSAQKDKFTGMIQKNSDQLFGIIEGLQKMIDYNPDIALSVENIDLNAVAINLMEQFSPYLEKVDGKLLFDFQEIKNISYPKVYLYSILSNLIGNSIKYVSGEPLMVHVSGSKQDGLFMLKVADNGIGINLDEHADQLFKPFNRFTQQGEGKGMGLSIVHYIVTKNGGNIQVESTPGKGTVFKCFLMEY